MGKKQIALTALFIFFAASSWAKELSLQVVQHNSVQNDVCEQTLVVEDVLLDYFCGKGDIVTNEPAVAVQEDGDDAAWKTAFAAAAEGGSKYFVQVRLFYVPASPADPQAVKLSSFEAIEWTVTEVQSGKKIADKKKAVEKSAVGNDDTDSVRDFAAVIAEQIQDILKG